ncbi:hypothetical protein RJ639_018903 [Escallonia herrerae]|uniref:Protein kinase domain-containing protein n=1 Tax=Escallonia herrerae TaxID=1293975 RepID=A0AA89AIH5_9ASTE|nr:hypothetical protein RJ639_018903 [Escallonia herrerae]
MVPLLLFIWLMIAPPSAVAATPSLAKPGCQDNCGNVNIPYPFGIGSNCYLNHNYTITCNQSFNPPKPYLTSLGLEVLAVSLTNLTIIINNLRVKHCGNSPSNGLVRINNALEGTPFVISSSYNRFTVLGCGNAILGRDGIELAGCSSLCNQSTTTREMGCYGINCCQTTFPFVLNRYNVNVSTQGDCLSEFLVDKNWIAQYNISDPRYSIENIDLVPLVLRWILQEVDIPSCIGYNTTFYFSRNISIKTRNFVEECANCRGECRQNTTDSSLWCQTSPTKSSKKQVILGVGISMGALFLIIGIFWLYKIVVRIKNKKRKEKFFKRNGGLVLRQHTSVDKGSVEKTLFNAKQLEKATDNFNENFILGCGGQGTVYKGMLTDGGIVAVKKFKMVDESQLEQFINEVVILSELNHRNVVKLLGCCLETEVPLLVYEFISNGTLFKHIHDQSNEFPLSWEMRLRIATEKPIFMTRTGEQRSLATHFLLYEEENRLFEIFDPRVLDGTKEELVAVANLARRCLNLSGKNRPTMKEIAAELEGIGMSNYKSSTVQTNFQELGCTGGAESVVLSYGNSTSMELNLYNSTTSSSDGQPLLRNCV